MNEFMLVELQYFFEQIKIEPKEVYTGMGLEDCPPEPIPGIMNEIWEQLPEVISIKGGYRIVENPIFNNVDNTLQLNGERFYVGKTIFHLLKKSEQIAIFVCSAGEGVSNLSKKLIKSGDLLAGYMADTAGSVIVEKAMDLIQEKLKENVTIEGSAITNRYSPGYCNWDVKEQFKLFSFLPDNFCEINLTESALMQPVKSVSGFIGIGANAKFNPHTCDICNSKNCIYRRKKIKAKSATVAT